MGVRPTDEEMRTHLAISPCNYWPFGSHPFFQERRASILGDAERWLDRLTGAANRTGRVPGGPLRAYADEILSMVERALEERHAHGAQPRAYCPVATPLACVTAEPCR